MKRFALILAGIIAFAQLPGLASTDVWLSSTSAVTAVAGNLCPGGQGAMLHSVCVVDGVATSSAAVYNSSFTKVNTQNLTGNIDGSETGKGCFVFDVAGPLGLYADHFGTAIYTILYQCYSRNN